MRLIDLVELSERVTAAAGRNEKIELVAEVLSALDGDELARAVNYLSARLVQGRIGLGWASVLGAEPEPAAEATLGLQDVHEVAELVASTTGEGSQAQRQDALAGLMARATQAEQTFLRALLLGELRQGAKEGIVVEAIARATGHKPALVRRGLMLLGDLGELARTAARGGDALGEVSLLVGRPIRPMLASSAVTVTEALADLDAAVVEAKLDGMRVQVHRDGDDVMVVTRSLRNITNGLPSVVEVVAGLDVDSIVLDGEALGIGESGRPLAFQDSMSVGDDAAELDRGLRPFFFDCLHLNGRDLLDEPLSVRLEALDSVVPARARVERTDALGPDDAQVGEDFNAEVLAAGHEGVVVKALDAPYQAGRRGKSWIKVKPVKTLDLVVLAVEWGSGRRQGWLSNLHLGARDPSTGGFVMLGKTFKGMTDEMLTWQTERFLELEESRKGHVVHVRPEQVVEIAFDGLQDSRRYPGGLALRFARVKRYREDKQADDADTIDTVRALRAAQG